MHGSVVIRAFRSDPPAYCLYSRKKEIYFLFGGVEGRVRPDRPIGKPEGVHEGLAAMVS